MTLYISPSASLYRFRPKGVIDTFKNDIGGDGDTYDHSLQLHVLRYFLLHLFLLIYHPYPLHFMNAMQGPAMMGGCRFV